MCVYICTFHEKKDKNKKEGSGGDLMAGVEDIAEESMRSSSDHELSGSSTTMRGEGARPQDVEKWTEAHVRKWLNEIDCGRYADRFESELVTGAKLLQLNANDIMKGSLNLLDYSNDPNINTNQIKKDVAKIIREINALRTVLY